MAEIDSTSQHIFYIKVNEIEDIKWLDQEEGELGMMDTYMDTKAF